MVSNSQCDWFMKSQASAHLQRLKKPSNSSTFHTVERTPAASGTPWAASILSSSRSITFFDSCKSWAPPRTPLSQKPKPRGPATRKKKEAYRRKDAGLPRYLELRRWRSRRARHGFGRWDAPTGRVDSGVGGCEICIGIYIWPSTCGAITINRPGRPTWVFPHLSRVFSDLMGLRWFGLWSPNQKEPKLNQITTGWCMMRRGWRRERTCMNGPDMSAGPLVTRF